MLYLLLGVGLILLVWISMLATRHLSASSENDDWRDLQRTRVRVEGQLRDFLGARSGEDPQAAEPPNLHAEAADVYGLLHANKLEEAVSRAELAMAQDTRDADARLLLAAALRAQGDLAAAASQLQAAESLGAKGSLCDYLQAQVEIEQYLEGAGSKSNNALLMPVEMLALELHTRLGDNGDASALWMPGEGAEGGEVSKEEARDFVLAHFRGYYRLLEGLIASQQQTEYSDSLYLLARLAIKCGFSEPGGQLLLSLGEAMRKSSQHKSYLRDLSLLRGEKPVVKEETRAAGKKIIKLKVLN